MSILGRALSSGNNSTLVSSAVLDPAIVSGDVGKFVVWIDGNSRFELMDASTTLSLLKAESWGLLTTWFSSGLGSVALGGSQSYTITAGSTLYWAIGATAPTATLPVGPYAKIGVAPATNTLFIEKDYEESVGLVDYKGVYVTPAALESAYPAASNESAIAFVNSSVVAQSGIYRAVSSVWVQEVRGSDLTSGVVDALLAASGTPATGNPFVLDDDSRLSDIATNTTHRGLTDNPHSVTSAQVGLGNVPNLTAGGWNIEIAGLLNTATDHVHTLRLTRDNVETLISTGTLVAATSESAGSPAHTHDVTLTFNQVTGAISAVISQASGAGHAGAEHGIFFGSGESSGGSGGLSWSLVSTDTAALDKNGYILDGTSGTVTLTLPATPAEGEVVAAYVEDSTNVITIARNASNINGAASDLTPSAGDTFYLVYVDATTGWRDVYPTVTGGAGGNSYNTVVNTGDWSLSAEPDYTTMYEATVTHSLALANSREFVAQFYDTDGWLVQLDVKAIDANSFKLFSVATINDLKVSVR